MSAEVRISDLPLWQECPFDVLLVPGLEVRAGRLPNGVNCMVIYDPGYEIHYSFNLDQQILIQHVEKAVKDILAMRGQFTKH